MAVKSNILTGSPVISRNSGLLSFPGPLSSFAVKFWYKTSAFLCCALAVAMAAATATATVAFVEYLISLQVLKRLLSLLVSTAAMTKSYESWQEKTVRSLKSC